MYCATAVRSHVWDLTWGKFVKDYFEICLLLIIRLVTLEIPLEGTKSSIRCIGLLRGLNVLSSRYLCVCFLIIVLVLL